MNNFLQSVLVIIAISSGVLLFFDRQRKAIVVWKQSDSKSIRGTSIKDDNGSYPVLYRDEFTMFQSDEEEDWPPLDSLIGDRVRNITGDVQHMLDFAIIGHPKTATTFQMNWLASHEEIQMYKHELHSMQADKPAELVSLLYELEPGRKYKRGYKAPRDVIIAKALRAFAKYFPKTKLMIGLRHPVLWFESFYNFRVRHGYTMPPAETLLGELRDGMWGVCTDEAKFHLHLDNLGKTKRTSQEEELLSWGPNGRHKIPKMKNPVFLYEINQLHDENTTRADQYLSDLKNFLGLKNDLNPIAKSSSSSSKEKTISICEEKYLHIRAELMKNAMEASIWIREYFLQSPDVVVSSPEYFEELLKTWLIDPCIMR